jgi:hypothetical protein
MPECCDSASLVAPYTDYAYDDVGNLRFVTGYEGV